MRRGMTRYPLSKHQQLSISTAHNGFINFLQALANAITDAAATDPAIAACIRANGATLTSRLTGDAGGECNGVQLAL